MRRGLTMDSPTLANLDKLLRWAARNWCLLLWSGRVEREETCCQIQSHLRLMRIKDHCCENILGVCSLSGLGCLWSFSCWSLLSFAYMRNTVLFFLLGLQHSASGLSETQEWDKSARFDNNNNKRVRTVCSNGEPFTQCKNKAESPVSASRFLPQQLLSLPPESGLEHSSISALQMLSLVSTWATP